MCIAYVKRWKMILKLENIWALMRIKDKKMKRTTERSRLL